MDADLRSWTKHVISENTGYLPPAEIRSLIGVLFPTVLGWARVVPFFWLQPAPGRSEFPWAAPDSNGEAIVITSIIGFVFGFPLIGGVEAFHLIGMMDPICLNTPCSTKV